MRLFVAVDLDDGVRRAVGRLIARMRKTIDDPGSLRIAWVAPERLHLTLHFLANVDAEMGARIAESVAAPIDLPPFHIAFGDAGTFSSRGIPNVLWLGLREGVRPLIALHSIIGGRLQGLGCVLEERPFSPHLTLARLRQASGAGANRRRNRGLAPKALGPDWTGPKRGGRWGLSHSERCLVDRVTLYESQLGREGATHTAIATGPLTPASGSRPPPRRAYYNGSAGLGGDGE
jgi:RNA 2',3'-cyclic 3'-phosphodiesterase